MSPAFDIVCFGDWWKPCSLPAELTTFAEDDLGSVVLRNLPVNLDRRSSQLADISHFAQIAGKYHYREWTLAVIFTEVQESGAARTRADRGHFACNAFRVPYVCGSLIDGQAGSRGPDGGSAKC